MSDTSLLLLVKYINPCLYSNPLCYWQEGSNSTANIWQYNKIGGITVGVTFILYFSSPIAALRFSVYFSAYLLTFY